MKADKPDLAKVKKLIADSGQEMIAGRQTAATGIIKIKGLLTKSQLAKFPTSPMFASRGRLGGPGMHGGGMGGPGMHGGMHGQPPPPTPGK
jgi:hypothetical protein